MELITDSIFYCSKRRTEGFLACGVAFGKEKVYVY